tara:strand:+ start:390 stop:761 length:372 start_codon:yes stop_codon:yes gene_type:complete
MKTLFSIFLIISTMTSVSAQSAFLSDVDHKTEQRAKELAGEYTEKLALTSKQQLLMQTKIGEFLQKKGKAEAKLAGREKLDMLLSLSQQENAEMRDILTQEQYDLYVRLKQSIQPLETVDKKD